MLDAPYDGRRARLQPPRAADREGGARDDRRAGQDRSLASSRSCPTTAACWRRPSDLLSETDNEQPMKMDHLLAAAGADGPVVELQDRVLRRERRGAQEGSSSSGSRARSSSRPWRPAPTSSSPRVRSATRTSICASRRSTGMSAPTSTCPCSTSPRSSAWLWASPPRRCCWTSTWSIPGRWSNGRSPRRPRSRPRRRARRRRRPPRPSGGRNRGEPATRDRDRGGSVMRIGVFVCHCGTNIAGTVDSEGVAARAGRTQGRGPHRGPHLHLLRARPGRHPAGHQGEGARPGGRGGLLAAHARGDLPPLLPRPAGLNPYLFEMANIREHCSWIHDDYAQATEKAYDIVKMARGQGARARAALRQRGRGQQGRPGDRRRGGRHPDRPRPGRRRPQGDHRRARDHHRRHHGPSGQDLPHHRLLGLHPDAAHGRRRAAREHRDHGLLARSTGCRATWATSRSTSAARRPWSTGPSASAASSACRSAPSKAPDSFNVGLAHDQGHLHPLPAGRAQAGGHPGGLLPLVHRRASAGCASGCAPPTPSTTSRRTSSSRSEYRGHRHGHRPGRLPLGGLLPRVRLGQDPGRHLGPAVRAHAERLRSDHGHVVRPSTMDKKGVEPVEPKTVVFIQCVGSRDESVGRPYCSSVCCMYTAKQAILTKSHIGMDTEVYVFYIDIRATGKGYEEFVKRAQTEFDVKYVRGRVSQALRGERQGHGARHGHPAGQAGRDRRRPGRAGLGHHRRRGRGRSWRRSSTSRYDEWGFYKESHPKLRPVETNTAGVFLAGACQSPKDIPTAVAQASGTASKVLGLLAKDKLKTSPQIAVVDQNRCVSRAGSASASARSARPRSRSCATAPQKSHVIETVCQGCGICVATCPVNCIAPQGLHHRRPHRPDRRSPPHARKAVTMAHATATSSSCGRRPGGSAPTRSRSSASSATGAATPAPTAPGRRG